jgi:uncharacterized membrane protein YjgN (DUF898 family)
VVGVIPSSSTVPSIAATDPVAVPADRTAGEFFTRASFSGKAGEFARLLLGGSILLIPTLGFYRFWLITDVRRHLWANTRLGNDSFEYTGTGKELLIGFLIALAILTPVYAAYFILGLVAENLQAFASFPLVAILYGFGQYALYRSRRYRATRTIFRGVRFWMTGSAWGYAGRALLWDIGTVLTLGLLYPWRTAALERYKMRNTRFGDLAGDFVATGGTFFRRGWWLWILGLLVPVALFVATLGVAAGANPAEGGMVRMAALSAGLTFALLFALIIIYWLLRGIQLRWYMEGIRFGPVEVLSDLRKWQVFGCYVRTFLAMLAYAAVAVGVMIALFYAVREHLAALQAGGAWTPATVGAVAALALAYLVFLVGTGLIKRYFLDRGVWRAIAGSTTVVNVAALDAVVAKGDVAGSLGEGLADALDFGGI